MRNIVLIFAMILGGCAGAQAAETRSADDLTTKTRTTLGCATQAPTQFWMAYQIEVANAGGNVVAKNEALNRAWPYAVNPRPNLIQFWDSCTAPEKTWLRLAALRVIGGQQAKARKRDYDLERLRSQFADPNEGGG